MAAQVKCRLSESFRKFFARIFHTATILDKLFDFSTTFLTPKTMAIFDQFSVKAFEERNQVIFQIFSRIETVHAFVFGILDVLQVIVECESFVRHLIQLQLAIDNNIEILVEEFNRAIFLVQFPLQFISANREH
jgi:hypothetical protein